MDVNKTKTTVPSDEIITKLGFNRAQKIESITPVHFDPIEFEHNNEDSFLTLFSVIFSLDQVGTINKEVTLIQDVDPNAESIDLSEIQTLSQTDSTINLHSESMNFQYD